jgi:hypothetical protein
VHGAVEHKPVAEKHENKNGGDAQASFSSFIFRAPRPDEQDEKPREWHEQESEDLGKEEKHEVKVVIGRKK